MAAMNEECALSDVKTAEQFKAAMWAEAEEFTNASSFNQLDSMGFMSAVREDFITAVAREKWPLSQAKTIVKEMRDLRDGISQGGFLWAR